MTYPPLRRAETRRSPLRGSAGGVDGVMVAVDVIVPVSVGRGVDEFTTVLVIFVVGEKVVAGATDASGLEAGMLSP